ncbi:MAG: hypothetical protein ACHRXM_24050 [Isosphaerales bacterium]
MWRTKIGERTLRGCEWDLFREGLASLCHQIEVARDAPELCTTGIGVFDRLQPAAKLAMLALVGTALRDENEPCPELTALTEGTFGAVYAAICQQIDIEIALGREDPPPEGHEFSMRALVLAAFRETNPDWENPLPEPDYGDEDDEKVEVPSLPEPNCEDMEEWDGLLDELMDRVLWDDRDFEAEELVLDVDPEVGRHLKKQLGIDADYYTSVAPEPTDEQLALIRKTLQSLCGRPETREGKGDGWF